MEDELAAERFSFIDISPAQRAELPNPDGPITVGIDGGSIRSCEDSQTHFEVTVGKSIPPPPGGGGGARAAIWVLYNAMTKSPSDACTRS